ncbi:MAG TPA: neuraminidase-like domain-containing protein [Thermodesulfobacteriota bacterium]|nr:neuraminidase-like domain-containing protein [Thermodesulfobacteriota bacterium]
MELQGRELKLNMRGDDVKLLHKELLQLGFEIPDEEINKSFFGKGTRKAVGMFQGQHGLETTGVVDEHTATLINAELDRVRPQPESFLVRGQVRQRDNSSLVGVLVQAFDKDVRGEEMLGEALTDDAGHYEIHYSAEQFSRAEKASADLIFRLFDQTGIPITNFKAVDESQNPFATIRMIDGEKQVNIPIVPQARQEETVNFLVDRIAVGPSEYERLLRELEPLLVNVRIEGIPEPTLIDKLADLNTEDIDFLTVETGIERQRIEFLSEAARLQKNAAAEDLGLPAEVFYGLFRQNLPTELPRLIEQGRAAWKNALKKSIEENIIPFRINDTLDEFLSRFQALIIDHALNKPAGEGRFSLGDLLSTAIQSKEKQARFLDLYLSHGGAIEEFWKSLRENPAFKEDVDRLQLTLQLGLLTLNHVPLVRELQKDTTLRSTRSLAKLDRAAWTEIINRKVGDSDQKIGFPPDIPGKDDAEKAANYINSIIGVLQATHPTAVIAGRIVAKAPEMDIRLVQRVLLQNPRITELDRPLPENLDLTGFDESDKQKAKASMEALRREINTFPDLKKNLDRSSLIFSSFDSFPNAIRQEVLRFLENAEKAEDAKTAPAFDFRTTHIDTYIAEHGEAVFDGIEDRAAVTSQLKRLQRVFQMSPGPEEMQALLGEGLDSAQRIINIPQETFMMKFKENLGGEENALKVYAKAEHISATALNFYAYLWSALYDSTPIAVDNDIEGIKQEVIKKIPNYNELFGGLDLCECEHCRSVYSPAAYFVDLLHFLDPEFPPPVGRKPIEVLLERRPDLEHIKLNCENTNTLIPYVDLVNEILEFYVANGKLDETAARDTADNTAEELKANPQFTIDEAYKKLKEAIYPLSLPFNRDVEVARTYLEHLGSSRYELMKTFQKDDSIVRQREIDAEYLKITAEEYRILTGKNFNGTDVTPARAIREFYGYNVDLVSTETAWFKDSLPQGAQQSANNDSWNFVTFNPAPPSGGMAHQSSVVSGIHQHYFQDATETLDISEGDHLFTQVFLDPNNLPEEIMLRWNDGTWEHRAYWGANRIGWGIDGTISRRYMGPLPPSGQWERLEIPAHFVGLEGKKVNGMAFTLYGGSATWGFSGKRSSSWQERVVYATDFLKRTGLSYMELIELLKTRFINPEQQAFEFLESINVSFSNLAEMIANNFSSPDPKVVDAFKKAGVKDVINWVKTHFNRLRRFVEPFAPGSSCNLSVTKLQHLSGKDLGENELYKMHRFIRLWRKLGWTMRDLDRTITAFKTSDIDPDFLQKLAQVKQIQSELKLPLVQLLSLWGNIDTQGEDSLYKKLFLNKAARELDEKFELNPEGSELKFADSNLTISEHIPTILAAFRIREADLAVIREDANLAADNALLNLANLSRLYRCVVLAKAVKLNIKDLISLKTLSGIDPFVSPDKTIQFMDIVRKVRQSGFTVAQLNYLYRHLSEPPASLAPQRETLLQLAQGLRDGLTKIAEENVIAPDPAGEFTRAKLGMIFEPAIVDQTIRMIDGSARYTARLKGLPDEFDFPEELKNKIIYAHKDELLSFNGPMTSDEQVTLKGLSGFLAGQVQKDYENAIDALFQQPRTFIKDTLNGFLNDIKDAEEKLLDVTSLDQNGKPVLLDKDGNPVMDDTVKPVTTVIATKFDYLLEKLLPYLRGRLSRSLVKQTLSDALKLDTKTTELLLERLLKSRKENAKPNETAIDDFLALHEGGLTTIPSGTGSVRWTGMLLASNNDDYTFYIVTYGGVRLWIGDNPQSIIDEPPTPPTPGQLPPELSNKKPITLKAGQLYELRLELHQLPANDPALVVAEPRWSSGTTPKDIIPSSNLYPSGVFDTFVTAFTLLHKIALLINGFKMTDKEVAYLSGHSMDFDNFDLKALPLDRYDPVQADQKAVELFKQWQRLSDFVTLRNSFPQGEVSLIDVFEAVSLEDKLPLLQRGSAGAAVIALQRLLNATGTQPVLNLDGVFDTRTRTAVIGFQQSHGLNADGIVESATWGALKAASPPNLWQVVMAEAAKEDKLVHAFGWDAKTLHALIAAFSLTADSFKNEIWLVRLQACVRLSKRLGISVDRLFDWATKEPDAQQSQEIKNTVKAKYDDEQWLAVAKPLNDILRESQKAALIAYLLADPEIIKKGITNSNGLYQYFLIDVEMDACMMTSRIKQGISSVQLFIQRCLLNLELQVSPSAIDADRWKWMKNYRVWEANRKVFLYPENWIEPELRDDKSPFFKELESELLQNDMTSDTVERAFLNYLEKLNQVARLEICGMYWELETDPITAKITNIIHVFGRTLSAPRVYYYRRLMDGIRWTPWEKVQADIEGVEEDNHVGVQLIPVVWNRRLHLFWPIFMEKPWPENNTTMVGIKLAWSQYRQNQWSPKQITSGIIFSDYQRKGGHIFKAIVDPIMGGLLIYDVGYVTQFSGNAISREGIKSDGGFAFGGCHQSDIVGYRIFMPSVQISSTGISSLPGRTVPDTLVKDYRLFHLSSTYPEFMLLKQIAPGTPFDLYDAIFITPYITEQQAEDTKKNPITVLRKTPSLYNILYLHQVPQYIPEFPFIYQDGQRTYFVTTRRRLAPNRIAPLPPSTRPTIIDIPDLGDLGPLNLLGGVTTLTEGIPVETIAQPRRTAFMMSGVGLHALAEEPWSHDVFAEALRVRDTTINVKFHIFFHPHVCEFIKRLNRYGIPGLLTPDNQRFTDLRPKLVSGGITGGLIPVGITNNFEELYTPTDHVDTPYPLEDVDFSNAGAYSLYNWELFFHAPMLLATRLSKNQRFEEALRWFHYIFDPTTSSGESSPERYWKVLPFKTTERIRIQDLLNALSGPDSEEKKKLIAQVEEWRDNPFNPHLIARMRLVAYMKNVVMKYIDNLIAWGDQLFRRDTIESINEATQLYVLAAEILGPRPQRIPRRGTVKTETYATLKLKPLGAFSNALADLENHVLFSSVSPSPSGGSNGTEGLLKTLYFCIPQNDKLLGYWDTVADRLFKIRHCMNIEGVVRELPLFEPPIDPALLVQAVAMGVDIGSVLNDINTPTPYYRFQYMLQKALELCAEVRSLGAALLSALEKKDAEELAAIRANHETVILNLVKEVKKKQKEESEATRDGLKKTREVVCTRYTHYKKLLGIEGTSCPAPNLPVPLVGSSGGKKLIEQEKDYLEQLQEAHSWQGIAADVELIAQIMNFIPNISLTIIPAPSMPPTPPPLPVGLSYGGSNIGAALYAWARRVNYLASDHTHQGTRASILAGYDRRDEEWRLQSDLAAKEIEQIDKQIAAANIRIDIAQKEIEDHDKQIENAKAIEEFLRTKYTNKELYTWMEGEISAVYNQCYQMAYDLAKKAEKTFRFERGLTSSNFIQFGYWDSVRKGLLSGEKLYLALKQMEKAYLDQNKREYEITKHVSLVLHDPMALIALKETGQCEVFLPEALFDADYPGHYMRRVKSVSLTIPCVVGPYTSINCTLTLLSNKTRIKSTPTDPYPESEDGEDNRFVTNFAAMQSIATSHAQNDSGMFELNFRDERYLPFEGAGVISRWRIDMPKDCNAFDFNTLSDVILHLKYTAWEGGEILKKAAKKAMQDAIADTDKAPLARLFSAKHEFPSEWHRFLHPADTATSQTLKLELTQERFPFQFRGKTIEISQIELFLKLKDGVNPENGKTYAEIYADGNPLTVSLTSPDSTDSKPLDSIASFLNGIPHAVMDVSRGLGIWVLTAQKADIEQLVTVLGKLDAIEDIIILCHYSVQDETP